MIVISTRQGHTIYAASEVEIFKNNVEVFFGKWEHGKAVEVINVFVEYDEVTNKIKTTHSKMDLNDVYVDYLYGKAIECINTFVVDINCSQDLDPIQVFDAWFKAQTQSQLLMGHML
jgi:hypothetical protein